MTKIFSFYKPLSHINVQIPDVLVNSMVTTNILQHQESLYGVSTITTYTPITAQLQKILLHLNQWVMALKKKKKKTEKNIPEWLIYKVGN